MPSEKEIIKQLRKQIELSKPKKTTYYYLNRIALFFYEYGGVIKPRVLNIILLAQRNPTDNEIKEKIQQWCFNNKEYKFKSIGKTYVQKGDCG